MSGTQEVSFSFTLQEWLLISAALGKLPLEVVINTFVKLEQKLEPYRKPRANGEARESEEARAE